MAARPKTVRIFRRHAGAAGVPATLGDGFVFHNDNGETLYVGGDSDVPHLIVGSSRQLELTGTQAVTTGAGNAKTFDTSNFKLSGGSPGQYLARGTNNGDIEFVNAPGAGSIAVEVDDPFDGTGTTGDPLTLTPATTAQIVTGTDDVFPVTSAGLRSQLGGALTTLTTSVQTGIIPAINSLVTALGALEGPLRFAGTYDADADDVTPTAPAVAGSLPAAAAGNTGWVFIVDTAGTGSGNAPAEDMTPGDWLISNGSAWIWLDINLPATAAANVSISAISGMTSTTVQGALAELNTALGGALTEVVVDDVSIVGAGTTGDPFEVGDIDCGFL